MAALQRPVPMLDARLRVERAKAAHGRLVEQVDAFHAAHPDAYRATAEWDVKGNVRVVAQVAVKPPRDWGLQIGDILADLQSALDYGVYALAVRHSGSDHPPNPETLEFPIAETRKWFDDKGVKKIACLSEEAVRYITEVQPFQPGYGGPTNALHVLRKLVGPSKHRYVPVVWIALDMTRLDFKFLEMELADFVAYKVDAELKTGTLLARFRCVAKAQVARLEMGMSIRAFASFDPALAGRPTGITQGLGVMGGAVEDVLNDLEAFL